MDASVDYYATLGVNPSSEDIVIQAAYRALMRRYHPDTNPSPEAAKRSQAINAAYAILSDPGRRKSYDAIRAAQAKTNNRGSTKPPPPPPPPPPKSNTASGESAVSMGSRAKELAMSLGGVAVLFLLGIAFFSAVSNSSSSASNTFNVDETMTTNEVLANDTGWIDVNATSNFSESTVANMTANETVTGYFDDLIPGQAKPSLAGTTQEPIRYDDIENSAMRFANILLKTGISGARAFSTNCHEQVTQSPSWSGADRCAAFDFAGAYLDTLISKQSGWSPNGYFRFQRENQADHYAAVGAPTYLTRSRLSSIQRASELAAAEALQDALAKDAGKAPTEAPANSTMQTEERTD